MKQQPHPMIHELALAMRDARRQARNERLDRRIPLLDRDFDNFAMGA